MSAHAAARLPVAELERVLERACGVALSSGVRQALVDGFARAVRESGAGQEGFLRRVLAEEARAVAALVENVVVGETYFYRHPEQLAALARELFHAGPSDRPLSFWSAGCATGEEPYTLSMMLLEAGRRAAGDRILATDVSARALDAARAGHYGEWSLRRLDPVLRQRHFAPSGRRLSVAPPVRARVEFQRHNLVRDLPPGSDYDVVVCRNVLIYFSPALAAQVVASLVQAVRPGGWLLIGPVEVPLALGPELERVDVPGATLLRRLSVPARRRPSAPALPVQSLPWADAVLAAAQAAPPSPAPPPLAPVEALEPLPPVEPEPPIRRREPLEAAREAARAGNLEEVERWASEAARQTLCPESYLLLAMAAEARGEDGLAVEAIRKALYLDPTLAQAHAALVALHRRLGNADEAARARRNALEALRGLDDETVLRGVEPITAGALRLALEPVEGRRQLLAAGRTA